MIETLQTHYYSAVQWNVYTMSEYCVNSFCLVNVFVQLSQVNSGHQSPKQQRSYVIKSIISTAWASALNWICYYKPAYTIVRRKILEIISSATPYLAPLQPKHRKTCWYTRCSYCTHFISFPLARKSVWAWGCEDAQNKQRQTKWQTEWGREGCTDMTEADRTGRIT